MGEGGGTEGFFGFHAVYAVFAVDAAGEFPDFFVEVWYTQFEGVCHCHLICFEQDVVWQPQMHIEEELFMKVVLIFYLVEVRFGYVLVAHLALVCRSEYFICFFVVHDECLADVGIFYGSCISLEEVKSSLVWLVFCPVSEFFTDRCRYDLAVHITGFAWDICLVSTEHLICAFST